MEPVEAHSDPVEELLAQCLERPQDEWTDAVEAAASEHPHLGPALRERFEAILKLGLAPPRRGTEFPERLGEFQLLERIGGGGMGVVFRALQRSIGREVALKVIRPEHLFVEASRERFRREVEAIAGLQHPNIISVYTVGEDAGLPYFTMELLDGQTLSAVLGDLSNRAPESLTGRDLFEAVGGEPGSSDLPDLFGGTYVETCLAIAEQVARAIDHAHARGILHRDVKPSNVVVSPDGRVVLLDFGLTSSSSSDSNHRITKTGAQLGTLAYMSPEQVLGKAELDPSADVYSLGVTLYELLTLHPPFSGKNSMQVQARILDGAVPSIRARNRRVPEDAETVCTTAMQRRVSDRYPSCAAFAEDMSRARRHLPIYARPPGAFTRGLRWCQRNVALASAVALGALLVVGLPTGFLLQKSVYAGELEEALEEVRAARDSTQAALTREREARAAADTSLAREREARLEANAALASEQAARRTAGEALENERAALLAVESARDEARQRLAEAEDVLGFVVGLFEQSLPMKTHGELPTAADILDLGAERITTELGERPRSRARILQTIGRVYMALHLYDAARPLLEESRDIWLGEADDQARGNLARALGDLGNVQAWKGDLDEAEGTLLRALELSRAHLPPASTDHLGILTRLADVLGMRERLEAALPHREEALDIVRESPQLPAWQRAVAHGALGSTYYRLERLDEAEPLLTRSVEIARSQIGLPDPGFAATLSNLGALRSDQGRYEEAEQLYREALEMHRTLQQGDDLNDPALTTIGNLGILECMRALDGEGSEHADEGLELLREAGDGLEAVLGPRHPRTLVLRSSRAMLLVRLERYEQARDMYTELIPHFAEVFGEGDIYLASAHLRVGRCQVELGELIAAARELERALEIMRPLVGFDPMKVEGLYFRGRALAELGDEQSAEEHLRAGLKLARVVPDAEHVAPLVELLVELVEGRGDARAVSALHADLERGGLR